MDYFAIYNQMNHAVYIKDLNLNYIGGNKLFLDDAGVLENAHIAGKNDFAMPWKKYATKYRKDDRGILEKKNSVTFLEPHIDSALQNYNVIVSKSPFYNKFGELNGVIGVYQQIPFDEEKEDDLKSLSKRQRQVFDATLRGLTAKEIAQLLHLKIRTVEYYLSLIKDKLDCSSKTQLLSKYL